MEALHQDQSMSQEDKMAKMKSLREDSNTKIEAVLNDTQKQQFERDAGPPATAHAAAAAIVRAGSIYVLDFISNEELVGYWA